MKKTILLIFSVFFIFFCMSINVYADFENEITEVTSEFESSQNHDTELEESSTTDIQEDESTTEAGVDSSPNSEDYQTELEALNHISGQNKIIIFLLAGLLGSSIARAFSFWKW